MKIGIGILEYIGSTLKGKDEKTKRLPSKPLSTIRVETEKQEHQQRSGEEVY